jgi:predicted nucleic acid-binding protein
VSALFDTNIPIDCLNGVHAARAEIFSHAVRAISAVTLVEVLGGVRGDDVAEARALLDTFMVVPVDAAIAERAVMLRRRHRLDLTDAIIWATAQVHGMMLITRDTRDFPADDPGILVPYRL